MNEAKPLLGSQNARPILWAGANGPSLQRLLIPAKAECGPQRTEVPTLFASRSGSGRRWYRSGVREKSLGTGPLIDTYSARYERDHARWDGTAGETVAVRLSRSATQALLHEDAEAFDLQTRYEVDDPVLNRLVHDLADEVQSGLPNGALYCDGLVLAMLGWLLKHYAAAPAAPVRTPTLSESQKRRVRELIEERIGEPLSVDQLAAAACLSPYHFARLFKSSFGTSPHRYLLQRRLDLALTMLKSERQRPIADVAAALGFASQSHLSHAMVQFTGMTPTRWRLS